MERKHSVHCKFSKEFNYGSVHILGDLTQLSPKIQIKPKELTPFGGIFTIMKKIKRIVY